MRRDVIAQGKSEASAAGEAPVWSPSRVYLVVAGSYLLLVAAVGFLLDASFPTAADDVATSRAFVFGLFETNGWHNFAALLLAVPLLVVAATRPSRSSLFALLAGGANAVVFVSFELWDASTFLVASNAADQIVHALLALGGIATAATTYRRGSTGATRVHGHTS